MTGIQNETAVELLISLLKDGDEAQRCYAAQAAGKIKATQTQAVLESNLYHQDPDVVIDSARALGDIAGVQSIQLLTDVAKFHPDGDARITALEALTQMGSSEVYPLVLDFAKGRPADDGWGGVAEGWDDWWDLQLIAIKALGRYQVPGGESILRELLEDENNLELELDLLNALAQHSEAGLDKVIEFTTSQNVRRRRRAVRALRASSLDKAEIFAFKALKDSDADIRCEALATIKSLQAHQYVVDVLSLLSDESGEVQKQAVSTLLHLAPRLADNSRFKPDLPRLFQVLEESHGEGTLALLTAISAMGQALNKEQIAIIRGYLVCNNSDAIACAAQLLVAINDSEATVKLCQQLGNQGLPVRVRIILAQCIAKQQDDSVEVLKALNLCLSDEDSGLRQVVLETLVAIDGQSLDLVSRWLQGQETKDVDLDPKEKARAEKLKAQPIPVAVEAQNPDPMEEILASVDSQYPEVQPVEEGTCSGSTLAAIAADNVKQAQAAPVAETQQTIMDMVEELPGELEEYGNIVEANFKAADRLDFNRRKIARPPSYDNPVLAARALGSTTSRRAIKLLLDALLGADCKLQLEIVKSLGRIASVDPDLSLLKNAMGPAATFLVAGDEQLRQASAQTLGEIGHQASIHILISALDDGDAIVRINVINALAKLISEDAKPATENDHVTVEEIHPLRVLQQIQTKLTDPESGVKQAAIRALSLYQVNQAIGPILECALNEEGLSSVVVQSLSFAKEEVIELLVQRTQTLQGLTQAHAIELLGELLAA